ncbi:PRC-barrel domain-containing protein [Sphingopyxis sp. R3-92]|uniref:PRC-barrel domain-containing protein n=1 Tax=Sphingopyxis sp. R3-92 TaxID=3158553 RepID=UPI003EE44187
MAEVDESTQLLCQSSKGDAMAVKTRDGDKLGHIHAFMMSKRSGRADPAIRPIGGFLRTRSVYSPLAFRLLSLEPTSDSYIVTIDCRLLGGGPSWVANAPLFDQAY